MRTTTVLFALPNRQALGAGFGPPIAARNGDQPRLSSAIDHPPFGLRRIGPTGPETRADLLGLKRNLRGPQQSFKFCPATGSPGHQGANQRLLPFAGIKPADVA